MSAQGRRQAILELIATEPLGTQAALAAALRARGIRSTQATLSRDIQRLGLVKAPLPGGGYRYRQPGSEGAEPPGPSREELALREALQSVKGLAPGEALLVIHTLPGHANAVAFAVDAARMAGVVGTLAGDDTVLVVTAGGGARERIRQRVEALAAGG